MEITAVQTGRQKPPVPRFPGVEWPKPAILFGQCIKPVVPQFCFFGSLLQQQRDFCTSQCRTRFQLSPASSRQRSLCRQPDGLVFRCFFTDMKADGRRFCQPLQGEFQFSILYGEQIPP